MTLIAGLACAVSSEAQIQKAAMRTSGLSCGFCSTLSEYNFKQMPGVDKVQISLSKEIVIVTYKPGAHFDPTGIRKVLEPWKVDIVQFQVNARGRVQQERGKSVFVAGNDKFVILPNSNGPVVPADTPVEIVGTVNDRANPKELRILSFKPAP